MLAEAIAALDGIGAGSWNADEVQTAIRGLEGPLGVKLRRRQFFALDEARRLLRGKPQRVDHDRRPSSNTTPHPPSGGDAAPLQTR